MKKYFIIIVAIVFLFSCEEKMVTIPEIELPTGDKSVLVEDLTGVRCTNCPTGATKLENLHDIYGDKLITISVHGNSLTDPVEEDDYDLGNEDADEIDNYLKPYIGKPAIAIDRRGSYQGSFFSVSGVDNWPPAIEKAFQEEVLVNLVANTSYDAGSRLITVDAIVTPQVSQLDTNNVQISVMLVESGIETTQKGPSGEIEEYEHHNVLRKVITSTTGEDFAVSPEEYVPTTGTYSYTLPAEDGGWVADSMNVVVFVAKGTTKEVLQTIIVPVVE